MREETHGQLEKHGPQVYEAYYASMPLRPGQIRLVRVWPAQSWYDPVVCHIRVEDISDSPPYNAVSYTWGGQTPEHAITCNGNEIFVTQSCVDALKGIRFQKLPVIWIDQLCINQFDLEERNRRWVFTSCTIQSAFSL